jgi:anti-anti-sigma factor
MDYIIDAQHEAYVVNLRGAFTFNDNHAFQTIVKAIEESAPSLIIMDFSRVEFIDSAALGMLLFLREEYHKAQGKLVLRHPKGQVRKIFELSKFDSLFVVEQ